MLLRFQDPLEELINGFPLRRGKPDGSTPLHQLASLPQCQSLYVLHGEVLSPAAWPLFPPLPFRLISHWKQFDPSGSSRIGNEPPLQAHSALDNSEDCTTDAKRG